MKIKNVYIIAGPNGSGKTTFAKEFLHIYVHCPNFINTDFVAQGLSPFSPEREAMQAGRTVLKRVREYASQSKDFGFETTLSGKTNARLFAQLRAKEYRIFLFFLWVPDAHLSLARIKQRVSKGGHNVPEKDVKRRFQRSLDNFQLIYKDKVDCWMFFDNSTEKPHLIASSADGKLVIEDKIKYEAIFRVNP